VRLTLPRSGARSGSLPTASPSVATSPATTQLSPLDVAAMMKLAPAIDRGSRVSGTHDLSPWGWGPQVKLTVAGSKVEPVVVIKLEPDERDGNEHPPGVKRGQDGHDPPPAAVLDPARTQHKHVRHQPPHPECY